MGDITNTSQAPPLPDDGITAQFTFLEPWMQCNICKCRFFEKLSLLMAQECSRAYDHHTQFDHPLRFYSKLLLCESLLEFSKSKECENICESELSKLRNIIRLNGYEWYNKRCLPLGEMESKLLQKI